MISQLRMQLPLYLLLLLSILIVDVAHAYITKPGCEQACGDVLIPYPFGIGANCSLNPWYEIECNTSSHSSGSIATPFLSEFGFEVMEINLHISSPSMKVGILPMNSCSTHQEFDLSGSPYDFSREDNVFVMEGCPGSAVLVNESKTTMAGCGTVCNNSNSAVQTDGCYGVHCCQAPLPSNGIYSYSPFPIYNIDFNPPSSGESQNCLVASIIESDSVNEYVGNLSSSDPASRVPVVLLWSWTDSQPENPHALCSPLYNYGDSRSSCYCKNGYYGNTYVSNGCQVAQECKDCRGDCYGSWDIMGKNTYPSSYHFCDRKPLLKLAAVLGLSISFGIVLLVIGIYGLYRFIKRRREIKRRATFFKRNGGLLLQQQLSSGDGVVERTKIFSMSELDKATDHFSEDRILGQGGQGTVYKGMLTDGRIVAIKKAKLLDESQLEQFINEVVILSQINHRNVVKLLGCCLETEVPLLVYEFVSNGTLFQHIHDPDEDFSISWEMSLKIAADSASAVSYLHSSSSTPVYHRDIKPSNILLDEKHSKSF